MFNFFGIAGTVGTSVVLLQTLPPQNQTEKGQKNSSTKKVPKVTIQPNIESLKGGSQTQPTTNIKTEGTQNQGKKQQ
ncbi:hypothetical protein [Mycoplasma suis]|uniref:hypothetical protein n=1 Tax=Mycoplasma suis TaxID=57372 RepID=UPI0002E7F8E4|nr:hypothetical protein [Mycoplasma suis]